MDYAQINDPNIQNQVKLCRGNSFADICFRAEMYSGVGNIQSSSARNSNCEAHPQIKINFSYEFKISQKDELHL